MATCAACGEQTSMPFRCKFCEQSFCSTHRLPENHDCGGLEEYTEQSQDAGKMGYDVVRNDTETSPEITSRTRNRSLTERIAAAVPRVRTGSNLPVTYIILGAMFVVFLMQGMFGNWFSSLFALSPGHVVTQPWTLVTSMFLHANLMHLLVNAIVLFSFGTEIERILGDKKYLGLLFAAGIMSSLGFALSGILFNMDAPAVGISGALFGLVAFLAIVRPSTRVLAFFVIPLKIRTAIAGFAVLDMANLVTQILHTAGFTDIPGVYSLLLGVDVASSGHLSGLLAGLLYGYYVKDRYRQHQPRSILSSRFNRRF